VLARYSVDYAYKICGYGSVDMDISIDIHGKPVDVDVDMDGKFHIHGKPAMTLY